MDRYKVNALCELKLIIAVMALLRVLCTFLIELFSVMKKNGFALLLIYQMYLLLQ